MRQPVAARVLEEATFDQRELPLFSIGGLIYVLQDQDVRYVMNYIEQSNSTSMRMTIHTRDMENMPRDVSNTEMLNFSDLGMLLSRNVDGIAIPCHGGSLYFKIAPPQSGVDPLNAHRQFLSRVRGIRWTGDPTIMSSVLDTGG